MIEEIYKSIKRKINIEFKMKLKHYLLMFFSKQYRSVLMDNKNYKNHSKKERCFIIGNGPSLKSMNLELLRDEDVFTVNQINRSNLFSKIKPKYHVIVDEDFFFLDDSINLQNERLKYIKGLQENDEMICIFPYFSKRFFDQLEFKNKILYFNFYTDAVNKKIKKIDMSKGLPTIRTVIQTAIYSAIYFGYKEIYLLGVDTTSYESWIKKIEEENGLIDNHVYKYSELEKRNMLNKKANHSNLEIFENYHELFKIYKNIENFCVKHSITIKNLTPVGTLDMYERDSLEKIIKNDKNIITKCEA